VKVIVKTDEYTIFQKRNERYAVRNAERDWVNGNEKVAILLEHKLIDVPEPKAPEPEEAEAAEEATAEADAPEGEAEEAEEAEKAEEAGEASKEEDK
jgi:hypothetical protein